MVVERDRIRTYVIAIAISKALRTLSLDSLSHREYPSHFCPSFRAVRLPWPFSDLYTRPCRRLSILSGCHRLHNVSCPCHISCTIVSAVPFGNSYKGCGKWEDRTLNTFRCYTLAGCCNNHSANFPDPGFPGYDFFRKARISFRESPKSRQSLLWNDPHILLQHIREFSFFW